MKCLILLLCMMCTNKLCNQTLSTPIFKIEHIMTETLEQEALKYYTRVARNLFNQALIKVPIDTFAKWCVIVAWCESNLNTKAHNGSQQGICQLTRKTRKYLRIPDNILDQTLARQVYYHYLYLTECSLKILKGVRSSEDLHFLNLKPFGERKLKVSKKTKALDFDNDGYITPNDLRLFQLKRIKENSVIEEMYNSLNA